MARLRDELDGWREALSDRAVLLGLLRGLLWAALLVGVGAWGVTYASAGTVLLVSLSAVLVALLVRVRLSG